MDPKYHPKIIGRRGAVISKIRDTHDVQIQFPERSAEREDVITITGFEKNAEAAREDILRIVSELVSRALREKVENGYTRRVPRPRFDSCLLVQDGQ